MSNNHDHMAFERVGLPEAEIENPGTGDHERPMRRDILCPGRELCRQRSTNDQGSATSQISTNLKGASSDTVDEETEPPALESS